jgi:single-strand DNA-binding protein
MASVNKVFLIGNLTRDPELRYTPNGAAVTDLGIACNRTYTTRDGERREEVTFIDVTVWNRQAETCCQYLKKGRPVHIEGFLKMDTWDDKTTGEKRSKVKVEAERVQFLDRRESPGGTDEDTGAVPPAREAAPRRAPGSSGPPMAGNGPGPTRGGFTAPAGGGSRGPAPEPEPDDDDIPF